jgi:hypothetical protein
MSTSQTVRTNPTNSANFNNPTYLTLDVKPSRILVLARAPLSTDGSLLDYCIDSTTGNFYFKDPSGTWSIIYNFSVAPGTGLTDLSNVGIGADIYTGVINPPGIANLRSLTSTGNTITFTESGSTLNLEFNNVAGYVDTTNNLAIGNGAIAAGITGSVAHFKTITSTGNTVVITTDANTVNLEAASTSGFINNIVNLVGGPGGLFDNITGSTANFRTITSLNGSLQISNPSGTVNLQVNPTLIFKDAASFGCTTAISQLLSVAGTPIPLALPFTFNGGRGTWSTSTGVIQRSFASNAPAPYLYNVQCHFQYSSNTVTSDYALIRFDMNSLSGNVSFAGSFTSSATMSLCGSAGPSGGFNGTYVGHVTITTLMSISDNNPAQFGVTATSSANDINIINNSTQITIVQI